jgi:RNA polymerase sigma-70 factor (ECF subfamily)
VSSKNAASTTNHETLRRAIAGDRDALAEVLSERMELLYRICYRILQQREDAEEAAAETCYRALTKLSSFRGDAQFTTWLYRVATNICYDMLRKRRPTQSLEDITPLPESSSTEPTAMKLILIDEQTRAVQRLMEALPPHARIVLLLREVEELSYEQIAQRLGCTVGTVKSRLNRAKRVALKTIGRDAELQSVLLRQKDGNEP